MKISVLTLCPELFDSIMKTPLCQRAIRKNIVQIEIVDIREFAKGSFRAIDDSPYGGGSGMILKCEPIYFALQNVKKASSRTILLSPKGKTYNQKKAWELSRLEHIILICGHFEGVDARVERFADEVISIGEYILSGGETASWVIIDSVIRLLEGVLKAGVCQNESYENGLLEYPQYTRPAEFLGMEVPKVLLSGNDREIENWRHIQSQILTQKRLEDERN